STPWRVIDRLNQNVEMAMAVTVIPAEVSDLASTKVPTDWLNWSHSATEAFRNPMNAQSSEIWRKNRWTCRFAITSGGIGQKSAARRWANGRPNGTDRRKAVATRAVPRVGRRK